MEGRLFLIPVTLGGENYSYVIPEQVIEITRNLRFFIVEEIRSARRFLRMIDRQFPIDESNFSVLNEHTPDNETGLFLLEIGGKKTNRKNIERHGACCEGAVHKRAVDDWVDVPQAIAQDCDADRNWQ